MKKTKGLIDSTEKYEFLRCPVLSDGDCGFTAFGITRIHAYEMIKESLPLVAGLIKPALKEALLLKKFIDYLDNRGFGEVKATFAEYVRLTSQHANAEDTLSALFNFSEDLQTLNAYIDYDIRDKKIDNGWSHPAVLQALAKLSHLELYIWQLNGFELVPHFVDMYAHFTPPKVQGRVDLLFTNGNHFERLDLVKNLSQEEQRRISIEKKQTIRISKFEAIKRNFMAAKSSVDQNRYKNELIIELKKSKEAITYLAEGEDEQKRKNTIFSLPNRNHDFYGRKDYLEKIQENFNEGNSATVTQVLSGFRGMGKTQIAKHYAWCKKDSYEIVFWFSGPRTLQEDFMALAKKIGVSEKKNYISHVIKTLEKKDNWLLIFDGFNSIEELGKYSAIPKHPLHHRGHVLITTNNSRAWPDSLSASKVEIEKFSSKDAINYALKKYLLNNQQDASLESVDVDSLRSIIKLTDKLGRFPLAIALAIAYLNFHPIETIDGYLQRMKDGRFDDSLEEVNKLGTDGYSQTTADVIMITLNSIIKESYGKKTIQLLIFLSFLNLEKIEKDIIEKWCEIKGYSDTEISTCIDTLVRYYLLDISMKNVYKMHFLTRRLVTLLPDNNKPSYRLKAPLLQQFIEFVGGKSRGGPSTITGHGGVRRIVDRSFDILKSAYEVLMEEFNYDHDLVPKTLSVYCVPHLEALEKNLKRYKTLDYRVNLLVVLGEFFYFEQRDNERAFKNLTKAIKIIEEIQEKKHDVGLEKHFIIKAYIYAAMAKRELGGFLDSVALAEKAETILHAAMEEGRSRELVYCNVLVKRTLGQNYSGQANYYKARQTLQEALVCRNELDGAYSFEKANILATLARVEYYLGDIKDALEHNKTAISNIKACRGESDYEVALYYLTNIEISLKLSQLIEAKADIDEFKKIIKASFNEADPTPIVKLAINRHEAMYFFEISELDKAYELFESIIKESEENYYYRASAYKYMAKISLIRGDAEIAERFIEKAIEHIKQTFKQRAESHPDLASAYKVYGDICYHRGISGEDEQLDRASTFFTMAQDILRKVYGQKEHHYLFIEVYLSQVKLYLSRNDFRQAKILLGSIKALLNVCGYNNETHVDYAEYYCLCAKYYYHKNPTHKKVGVLLEKATAIYLRQFNNKVHNIPNHYLIKDLERIKTMLRPEVNYEKPEAPQGQAFSCWPTGQGGSESTPYIRPYIRGLRYQEVPGDGHCLYHAVGLYLGETQQSLRNIVASHLESNIEGFKEFINLSQGRTINDYIMDIKQGKEWASEIEIEILMRVLNRPIAVIGPEGTLRNRDRVERFMGEPIFVYYNGHDHYDAFLLNNPDTLPAKQILEQLTEFNEGSQAGPKDAEQVVPCWPGSSQKEISNELLRHETKVMLFAFSPEQVITVLDEKPDDSPEKREILKQLIQGAFQYNKNDLLIKLNDEGHLSDFYDNQSGDNALHLAIKNEKSGLIEQLNYINPSDKNKSHQNALHCAVISGSLSLVKKFLACENIDLNERAYFSYDGFNDKISSFSGMQLTSLSAEPSTKFEIELTALQYAIRKGNVEIVKAFFESPRLGRRELYETTHHSQYNILHLAVLSENLDMLDYMLKSYERISINDFINQPTIDKLTPLGIAGLKQSTGMISALIEAGAQIRPAVTDRVISPLICVTYSGDIASVIIFVEQIVQHPEALFDMLKEEVELAQLPKVDILQNDYAQDNSKYNVVQLTKKLAKFKSDHMIPRSQRILRKNYMLLHNFFDSLTSLLARIRYNADKFDEIENSFNTILKTFNEKHVVKRKYENIVFQGGGPKGIAYVGALYALKKTLGNEYNDIRRVAGTSAGAITALLVALGLTPDQIANELNQKNLTDFLEGMFNPDNLMEAVDNPNVRNVLKAALDVIKGYYHKRRSDNRQSVLDAVGGALFDLYHEPALAKGDLFLAWVEDIIFRYTGKSNLTFGELRELVRKKNPLIQNYRHLFVLTTDITYGKPIVLQSEYVSDFDNVIISHGIRASISIPFIFEPHQLHIKTSHGPAPLPHSLCVDGGLLRNYPIELFDGLEYQPFGFHDRNTQGFTHPNRATIGFSLYTPQEENAESSDEGIQRLEDSINKLHSKKNVLEIVSQIYLNVEIISHNDEKTIADRTVFISNLGVSLLQFNLRNKQKADLINTGREATYKFLRIHPFSPRENHPFFSAYTNSDFAFAFRVATPPKHKPVLHLPQNNNLYILEYNPKNKKEPWGLLFVSEGDKQKKINIDEVCGLREVLTKLSIPRHRNSISEEDKRRVESLIGYYRAEMKNIDPEKNVKSCILL